VKESPGHPSSQRSRAQSVVRSALGPTSNRGFWLIAIAFAGAGAAIVAGVWVTRPAPASSRATANLALAARAANIVRDASTHGYSSAEPGELGVVELRLAFVAADRPSIGPRVISVLAAEDAWVGAALDSDGVCRWIRIADGPGGRRIVRGRTSGGGRCTAATAAGTSEGG
jgi:hypothetical protein